jgi:hypothetical protein
VLGFIYGEGHLVKGSFLVQLRDSLLVDFEISERCLVCVKSRECTSVEIMMVRRSKQEDAFTAND